MRALLKERRRWLLVIAAPLLLAIVITGLIIWRVGVALTNAKQSQAEESNLKFTVRPLMPVRDNGFEWVSAPSAFTQAAVLKDHLYVAGPVGLFEYDGSGRPVRDYRVGRELPPAPLIRIATATLADSRDPELVIATDGAGILAFNGSTFRQLLPEDHDARSVTAILPTNSGHLLIGTAKHGVLLYDGRRLTPFHPALNQLHVTELAGSDADLWVGTLDKGVAHWHAGSADWFDTSNGLPDLRVYSIAISGTRTYVGGPAGIAEFDAARFSRVLAAGGFVRAILPRDKSLLAGTMDDGILEISLEKSPHNPRRFETIAKQTDIEQLFENGNSLYAVTAHGVFARENTGRWNRVLTPAGGLLADRNVSALAVDTKGNLWIGYFDRGLDIVDGQHARHVEDDHVFCVNRIRPNVLRGSTAVATANGLVLFDAQGNRRQVLSKSEGLIADHVTDVTPFRDGVVLGTPAGLTYMDSTGIRSLYAFHGLVNNHVYTVAASGNNVMAGTLGGLSLLEGDQVRANQTTANSGLKHNWITATLAVGNEWWIGTYGAGIQHMDSTGKLEVSNGAGGDLVINPNAMLATDRLILAGTMGKGLYAMDRKSGKWLAITDGLPSLNVTALASANGFVYVGTDNGLLRIPEQRLER